MAYRKTSRTPADYAMLRERAAMMYQDGSARAVIAQQLRVSRTFVDNAIAICDVPKRTYKPRAELKNPWLPADEEANVLNYWVPTPERIAEMTAAFRMGHLTIASAHGAEGRQRREAMNRA